MTTTTTNAGAGGPIAPAPQRLAVLAIRGGRLPDGWAPAVAAADGCALLVGDDTDAGAAAIVAAAAAAAAATGPAANRLWVAEYANPDPGVLAWALAPLLAPVERLLLPDTRDGTGLAARLAAALDRPLLTGALRILPCGVEAVRCDGRVSAELSVDGPFVATLTGPGAHGTPSAPRAHGTPGIPGTDAPPIPVPCDLPPPTADAPAAAVSEQVLPPEPGAAELRDAPRILGAGAGLGLGPDATDGSATISRLNEVAALLDAAVGATRVVTDAGWLGEDRQIGITGAVVDPELYLAFGVSGAAQHLGGLARVRHVVSVNIDPFCPMTAMADLGLVYDAAETLTALTELLEGRRA